MRIGELARQAGVTTSRIRFYEDEGLLARAARAANGYRSYGPRDLKIIAFIERAQRLGFSLKDIGAFLATHTGRRPARATLLGHLRTKLAEIDVHIAEARKRRSEVLRLMSEIED